MWAKEDQILKEGKFSKCFFPFFPGHKQKIYSYSNLQAPELSYWGQLDFILQILLADI